MPVLQSLIIEPMGGLANRLRVTASAAICARSCGRELLLDWQTNSDCGARWEDLFENEIPSHKAPLPPGARTYSREPVNFARPGPGDLCEDPAGVVRVRTYFNFKPRTMSMRQFLAEKAGFYGRLAPIAPVRERLRKLQARAAERRPIIGIHIRRTDLVLAGDPPHYISPTELFIRRMHRVLKDSPSAAFFLATDDPEEEERIMAEFPARVFIHPKTDRRRDTAEGIREALVDWLALSTTQFILRSAGTSFSREAALAGGVPRETILRPLWPYNRPGFWIEAWRRRVAVAHRLLTGRGKPC